MKQDLPARCTLRLELVQCGKAKCQKWHGPYWYAFWEEDGVTRKRYVGKTLPKEVAARRLEHQRRRFRTGAKRSAHDGHVLEVLELLEGLGVVSG